MAVKIEAEWKKHSDACESFGMTPHESAFWWMAGSRGELPSQDALTQWRLFDLRGVLPSRSNERRDFFRLREGKAAFYMVRNELRKGWIESTDAWPGRLYLAEKYPMAVLVGLLDGWYPNIGELVSDVLEPGVCDGNGRLENAAGRVG